MKIYRRSLKAKNFLLYSRAFNKNLKHSFQDRQCILLATLPRSGTHYVRSLIANYLTFSTNQELLYIDQVGEVFPKNFQYDVFDLYSKNIPYKKILEWKQNLHLRDSNVHDIVRTHLPFNERLFKNFFLVHTTREVVSFFESYIAYMYLKRGRNIDQIGKIFDQHLPYYFNMTNSFKHAKNCVTVDYEELISDPAGSLSKIVRVANSKKINNLAIEKAVEISALKKTIERENKKNKVNKTALISGSFTNSGHSKFILDSDQRDLLLKKVKTFEKNI